MLRKVFLFVLLLSPLVVRGQLLSVTATLTDSDGTLWVNGTCSVQVYSPNGAPFFGSTPVPTAPQTCAIDGSGVLTTSIYNTSTITPIGAQYRFNINSATSAPGTTFLTPVTAANMTSTLVAAIAPTPPRFSAAVAYTYGYADIEAIATAPGGQYFKTTATAGTRIWSGSAWTSGGGSAFTCNAGSNCAALNAANTFTANITVTGGGNSTTYGSNTAGAGIGTMTLFSQQSIILQPSFATTMTLTNASTTSTVPIIVGTTNLVGGTGALTLNQAACIKSAGPPVTIGICSTVVSAGGACTCS